MGVNGIHEGLSHQVVSALLHSARALGQDRQIFGHVAAFNSLDHGGLKGLREQSELLVIVQLGSVQKASGPGEDGSNWVCGGRTTLLPDTVVTGYSAVGSLSLQHTVGIDTDGSHEAERTEALSNNIGLHITIVVFAGPNKATVALNSLSDKIINESVLVVETLGLKFSFKVIVILLLENVHKETVILLEDSVLGGQLEGHTSLQGVAHAAFSERSNRFFSVEHSHKATSRALICESVNELAGWL